MISYTTIDTELKIVADAIRSRVGISGSLAFPDGFISALDNIQTLHFEDLIVDGTISGAVSLSICSNIKPHAFILNKSITYAEFPACMRIGSKAFYSCASLSAVSFPACTSIGSYAFYSCASLSAVSFPACISVGSSAFAFCTSLSVGSFPEVEVIRQGIFYSCGALTEVYLQKCNTIYSSAFYGCSSLSAISLPLCSYIAANVFNGCISLYSVYLLNMSYSVSLQNTNAFLNSPISVSDANGVYGSIFVPQSKLSWYQSATNWAVYSDRLVGV